MLQLSNRHLTSSRLDGELFVGREKELRLLEKTGELDFNTLILGERGAGKTSLMYRYLRRMEDAGRPCFYMHGPQTENPAQILELARGGDAATGNPKTFNRKPVIILDGIDGKTAHRMFGLMRQEAWETDCSWTVCGQLRNRSEYLSPPADGFYEAEIIIEPMDDDDAAALLEARLARQPKIRRFEEDTLATEIIRSNSRRIVRSGGGNPSRILAEARAVVLRDPEDEERLETLQSEAEKLGCTAGGVWRYLLTHGPTSASNGDIAEHFGVGRVRITQVFQLLEKAGLVSSHREKIGRGQPLKLYKVNLRSPSRRN